jgi:hypothetical protein
LIVHGLEGLLGHEIVTFEAEEMASGTGNPGGHTVRARPRYIGIAPTGTQDWTGCEGPRMIDLPGGKLLTVTGINCHPEAVRQYVKPAIGHISRYAYLGAVLPG